MRKSCASDIDQCMGIETHADDELRGSSAGKLLKMSPKRWKHWRDNGSPSSAASIEGQCLHGLMTANGKIVPIEGTKWVGLAKEERKEAEEAGNIPVLRGRFNELADAAAAANALLEDEFGATAVAFVCEKRRRWKSLHGIKVSCQPDIVVTEHNKRLVTVVEVKSTGDLTEFGRAIVAANYDVQREAYLEGERRKTQYHVVHRFLVQETKGCLDNCWWDMDADADYIGQNKWAKACGIFRECTASGVWPSATPKTYEPSGREMSEWR